MSEYVSEPLPNAVVSEEPVANDVEESVSEAVASDPEPEPEPEPVVQEVSTETVDNSKVNELEERVKVLEERLEKLITLISDPRINNLSIKELL
jgi:hypothetical protein